MPKTLPENAPCPCGKALTYDACCAPLHQGAAATTAELLMRSRYSAYVLKLRDYLLATWHPATRPPADELGLDDAPGARTAWLGLELKSHRATGQDTAEVEFVARFRVGGGRAQRLVERSRFERIDGRWFYRDGDLR